MKLTDLALRIGISYSYLCHIEAGRVQRPRAEVLAAIALNYGFTEEELSATIGPKK